MSDIQKYCIIVCSFILSLGVGVAFGKVVTGDAGVFTKLFVAVILAVIIAGAFGVWG